MPTALTDAKWKRFLLLCASGALTGLMLVFTKLGFLEWITLVPMCVFLLLEIDSDKRGNAAAYGYGFVFFMSFYTVVFHWFINLYPLDFIDGMTTWAAVAVVLAGCIGLSALQAFLGGFMFVVTRLLFRTALLRDKSMLRPLCIAAVYTVYEWTQNLGWWGVPWGRLPLGQTDYIVGLQTSSLFSSYFVTFVIVLVNASVAYAIVERKAVKAMTVTVLCTLLFQYGAGTILYLIPTDGEKTVRFAAVQGNISSNEKWNEESRERTFEVYAEYTAKAAENGADVVVWPETALPYTVTAENKYGRYCSALAKKTGATILVGAFSNGEMSAEQYNSIICVLPDGTVHDTVYSKRRLVPFGEFVPMRELFEVVMPPLAELVMTSDDVRAGEDSEVFQLDGVSVGGLVCFDSIYGNLSRDSVRDGAQVIALSTNDSWFTDSAALYMHNTHAKLRAIENGRYVVRAANTGISTVISSKGEVLCSLEPLVDGIVEYDVSVNTHKTLYSVIGDLIVGIFLTAILAVLAWDLTAKIRHRASK